MSEEGSIHAGAEVIAGESLPASEKSGCCILLIEPDGDSRDAAKSALADLRFDGDEPLVVAAQSVAEATAILSIAKNVAVVVIAADLLAGAAGQDPVRQLRQTLADRLTRIIVRTGQVDDRTIHEAVRHYDVDGYAVEGPGCGDAPLQSAVILALRSYRQIRDLLASNVGAIPAREAAGAGLDVRRDELVQASFRLRAVLGAAPLPIVVATLDETRITFANQRAAQLWGTRADRVAGRMLTAIFSQDAQRSAFVEGIARDGSVDGLEVALTADGRDRWALISAVVISFGDQPLLLATIVDITDLKKMEHALLEAKNAAEHANVTKSHFLATMSHELRTPLNAILGFSEIIREQQLGPTATAKYAEYAGDIYESGSLLLDLINDILDIAKIEAGALEVEMAHVDLPTVLAGATRLVRVRADRAGLLLTTRIPGNLPPVVADPRAIKQVLFNLLTNAIKFTPKGGSVELSAEMVPDQTIALKVTDTGCGIPADQLERVMQPFQQLDNRYARSEGGSGLGLALVKALTSLHGGTVRIESEVGQGTTVTIVLPLAPPLPLSRDSTAA